MLSSDFSFLLSPSLLPLCAALCVHVNRVAVCTQDKNKSPDAAAHFQLINDAYEVLSDVESRRLYERWGSAGVAKDLRQRAALASRGDTDTLVGMAGFYVVWAALTYLMTIGRGSSDARTWSLMGLVVMVMLEFQVQQQRRPWAGEQRNTRDSELGAAINFPHHAQQAQQQQQHAD